MSNPIPCTKCCHPNDCEHQPPPANRAAEAAALPGAQAADASATARGDGLSSSHTDGPVRTDAPRFVVIPRSVRVGARGIQFDRAVMVYDIMDTTDPDEDCEVARFSRKDLAEFACRAMNAFADSDGLYMAPESALEVFGLIGVALDADKEWHAASAEDSRLFGLMKDAEVGPFAERVTARMRYEEARESTGKRCRKAMDAVSALFAAYTRQPHPTKRPDGQSPKLGDAQASLAAALGVPADKLCKVADAHAGAPGPLYIGNSINNREVRPGPLGLDMLGGDAGMQRDRMTA